MSSGVKRLFLVVMAVGWLGAVGAARGDDGKVPGDGAAWSAEVNGVKGRIKLEICEIYNGTPIISTRMELRNVRDVSNPLTFAGNKASARYRVEDAAGKELPMGSMSYSGGGPGVPDLVLPFKAELSFDITGRGAGIGVDQGALLDLGPAFVRALPRDGKDYFLKGTLELAENKEEQQWYGKLEFPAVKIPTKVEPMDPVAAGKLIAELGPKMLGKDSRESENARRRMSLIEDERVIPWYVKLLETDRRDAKFAALDQLARFKSDEVLADLKKGMATKGADIENGTFSREEVAGEVRHCAALALARSPNPEAKKLLLTMWNDRSYGVRVTVVQTAAGMDSAESLVVLQKMAKQGGDDVRGEAVRCLGVRESRRGPATEK